MGAQTHTVRAVCQPVAIALSLFLSLSLSLAESHTRVSIRTPTHIYRERRLSLSQTCHPSNSSHVRTHSHNLTVRPFLRLPPPLFAHTRACAHALILFLPAQTCRATTQAFPRKFDLSITLNFCFLKCSLFARLFVQDEMHFEFKPAFFRKGNFDIYIILIVKYSDK